MVKIPRSIVPIIGEPDIDESYIRQQDVVLLKTLLIDRTMTALNRGIPVNIKWAVDDYANEYPDKAGYGCEDQITLDAISSRGGRDLKVVTPRVKKRKEEQDRRTAQKAEVFTPCKGCKSGKLVPTNGYLIVAGENVPGIRPPRVRCRAYRGTDKSVWYDQRECEGPIAEQIHDAYAFVCKNMRVGSELVATRRRDVYELPVGSVREAICNAVFHRNYLEPSEVYVALYDDRLEITSSGGLVRDMTIEQAEHGYSKIRNDGLALALSYMKEVEGWGGGVARYFSDWTAAGLPRQKLEETPGFFKVVFDRKRKANEPLNETVNEPLNETVNDTVNETVKNIVANLICKAPGIGSAVLVSAVGKSRATVMRAVALLKQQGIIEHRGSDKTGGYFPTASAQKEAK